MSTPDIVERTRLISLRGDLTLVLTLVVVWTLLWGELSVANVLSGLLVAGALVVVFPIGHDVPAIHHRFRPLAALGLVAYVFIELVHSTLITVLDVFRPRARVRTGIVACPLRVHADGLVTFLANVIALSPGTMAVEVGYHPHVIYVHALRMHDPDVVRSLVSRLEQLSVRALGGSEAMAAVSRPAPWEQPQIEEGTDVEEGP